MKKLKLILPVFLILSLWGCVQKEPVSAQPVTFEQIMALKKGFSESSEAAFSYSSSYEPKKAPPSDIDMVEDRMFRQSAEPGGIIRVKCTEVQNYTKVGKDAPDMYVIRGYTITAVEITHIYEQYNTQQLQAGDSISYQERYAIIPETTDAQMTYLRRLGLNPVLLEDGTLEPSIYAELDVRTDWRFELQEGDQLDGYELFFYDCDILPLKEGAEYLMVVKYDSEKSCFVPQYTTPCDMSLYPNLSDRKVFRILPLTLQVMDTMREKYLN